MAGFTHPVRARSHSSSGNFAVWSPSNPCMSCVYIPVTFHNPPSSALNNCPSSLVAKLEVGTGAGTWGPESLAVEKGLGTPGRRVFLEHPLPLLHLVAAPDTSPPAAPQFLATSSLGLAMGLWPIGPCLCTSFPGTPSLRQTAKYRHCQCWDSTLGKRKR